MKELEFISKGKTHVTFLSGDGFHSSCVSTKKELSSRRSCIRELNSCSVFEDITLEKDKLDKFVVLDSEFTSF